MACRCDRCRELQVGCLTGITCDCIECERPQYASIDLNIQYTCDAEYLAGCCDPVIACGSFSWYSVQSCDVQDRYDSIYNGTIILEKQTLTTPTQNTYCNSIGDSAGCGIFGYQFYNTYTDYNVLGCLSGVFGTIQHPYMYICVNSSNIFFQWFPLEIIPCACTNHICSCLRLPGSTTDATYERNQWISCDATQVEYRLKRKGACISMPRTLTIELFD